MSVCGIACADGSAARPHAQVRHTAVHGPLHCCRGRARARTARCRGGAAAHGAAGGAAAQPGACRRPHVPAHLRHRSGVDRGRVRLRALGGPDALQRRRLRALRPGFAARGPAGRPVGAAAHDAAVLRRDRRLGAAGCADAQCLATGGGADPARRLCLDLPPGGHSDAAAARTQPRRGHRRQRSVGQPGHRRRGAEHRLHGAVVRLARGLRHPGAAGHRRRAAVRTDLPARSRGAGQARLQGAGDADTGTDGARVRGDDRRLRSPSACSSTSPPTAMRSC